MKNILTQDIQWFLQSRVTSKAIINKEAVRVFLTLMDSFAPVSVQISYKFGECRSPWIIMHLRNLIESDFH